MICVGNCSFTKVRVIVWEKTWKIYLERTVRNTQECTSFEIQEKQHNVFFPLFLEIWLFNINYLNNYFNFRIVDAALENTLGKVNNIRLGHLSIKISEKLILFFILIYTYYIIKNLILLLPKKGRVARCWKGIWKAKLKHVSHLIL